MATPEATPQRVARMPFATEQTTFAEFFERSMLNPHAALITGMICGVRVEEIDEPLMQQVRSLDKLVDELAKGRVIQKVLRS